MLGERGGARGAPRARGGRAAAPWALDKLRRYVGWARRAFRPRLAPAALDVARAYYRRARAGVSDGRDHGRTTVRLLESLVRLAQAHARLCARDVAGEADAVWAVLLVESSVGVSGRVGAVGDEAEAPPSLSLRSA